MWFRVKLWLALGRGRADVPGALVLHSSRTCRSVSRVERACRARTCRIDIVQTMPTRPAGARPVSRPSNCAIDIAVIADKLAASCFGVTSQLIGNAAKT